MRFPRFHRASGGGLIYAATARCKCGAGLAYRPGDDCWDCSDILLGVAITSGQTGAVQHTDRLPFSFYEIKSEQQPSARGATTRERILAPKPDWVAESERNTAIVKKATGIDGHPIRCGWAVLEPAGIAPDMIAEACDALVGLAFRWPGWNEGAIVAAEPCAGGAVRVDVWAVPR